MSIIVDANCAHRINSSDVDGSVVLEYLVSGRLTFVTGGTHKNEIAATPLGHLLQELRLAGRLVEFLHDQIDQCSAKVFHLLRSNDAHVIGLGLASGCRTLYTHDQALIDDFTDGNIIRRPRGKVYKHAKHRKLLEGACS